VQRGNVVLINLSGDYGKPRPCVIVQNDLFHSLESVLIAPITSDVSVDVDIFRIILKPTKSNGLLKQSQIMLDKIVAVRKSKIKKVIGKLNRVQLADINKKIILLFGIS